MNYIQVDNNIKFLRAILFFIIISFIGFSCNQSSKKNSNEDNTELTELDPSIKKARKEIDKLIDKMGEQDFLVRTKFILNQPPFHGVLKEWGCIAIFEDGKLIAAQTMKVLDFQTGINYPVRPYSERELSEAYDQIIEYHKMGGYDSVPFISIPFFSESFMLAVAKSVLDKSSGIEYALGRGTGKDSQEMQVIKIIRNSETVIAADALYALRKY